MFLKNKNNFIVTLFKIAACFISSFFILKLISSIFIKHKLFWDLNVYTKATDRYLSGLNPYKIVETELPFVYNPLILEIFGKFETFLNLNLILLVFYFISTCLFFISLFLVLKKLSTSTNLVTDYIVLMVTSLSFGHFGLYSIQTGNITLFLHFFLNSLILFFLLYKKKALLITINILIILMSIIKPYFLAYILINFLFLKNKSALISCFITFTSFSALWYSSSKIFPILFNQFLVSLNNQTYQKGDLGFSIFSYIYPLFKNLYLSLFLHLCFCFLLFLLYKKFQSKLLNKNNVFLAAFYVCMFIIILNPRMKVYDFSIVVSLSFILLYIKLNRAIFPILCLGLFLSSIPYFLIIIGLSVIPDTKSFVLTIYILLVLVSLVKIKFKKPSKNKVSLL